ncbi:hypothetical protein Dsin_016839 [Dipteronia sinensis]|uniref:Uncharacterized protein n=1 Tax=Dipteronia sinensis TaxID=43782 RepID=A0AAE0AEN9_9ROSI|nr:hypothetical protein Dsin_016839 [Dipteronia sinensis]
MVGSLSSSLLSFITRLLSSDCPSLSSEPGAHSFSSSVCTLSILGLRSSKVGIDSSFCCSKTIGSLLYCSNACGSTEMGIAFKSRVIKGKSRRSNSLKNVIESSRFSSDVTDAPSNSFLASLMILVSYHTAVPRFNHFQKLTGYQTTLFVVHRDLFSSSLMDYTVLNGKVCNWMSFTEAKWCWKGWVLEFLWSIGKGKVQHI